MPLEVTSRETEPGIIVIYPVGSIDSQTHDILQQFVDSILAETSPRVLVFDMAGVRFISSMGLRVVLRTRKTLRTLGAKLLLTRLNPQIKRVFDLVRALPQERIFASLRELDAYLAHMQRETLEKS